MQVARGVTVEIPFELRQAVNWTRPIILFILAWFINALLRAVSFFISLSLIKKLRPVPLQNQLSANDIFWRVTRLLNQDGPSHSRYPTSLRKTAKRQHRKKSILWPGFKQGTEHIHLIIAETSTSRSIRSFRSKFVLLFQMRGEKGFSTNWPHTHTHTMEQTIAGKASSS